MPSSPPQRAEISDYIANRPIVRVSTVIGGCHGIPTAHRGVPVGWGQELWGAAVAVQVQL